MRTMRKVYKIPVGNPEVREYFGEIDVKERTKKT
jgi:hypothetical protein